MGRRVGGWHTGCMRGRPVQCLSQAQRHLASPCSTPGSTHLHCVPDEVVHGATRVKEVDVDGRRLADTVHAVCARLGWGEVAEWQGQARVRVKGYWCCTEGREGRGLTLCLDDLARCPGHLRKHYGRRSLRAKKLGRARAVCVCVLGGRVG
jgi:hypothetical protein